MEGANLRPVAQPSSERRSCLRRSSVWNVDLRGRPLSAYVRHALWSSGEPLRRNRV